MKYEDGQYYDAKIIGVRRVTVGEKGTNGLEFALEMGDGKQDGVIKFISPNALSYTKERLIDLGCATSDITGPDWLIKINAKLSGVDVRCKAKTSDKGNVRIEDLYLPKSGAVSVDAGASPFDGVADEGPANPW